MKSITVNILMQCCEPQLSMFNEMMNVPKRTSFLMIQQMGRKEMY
jgi:hypothetical protein